MRGQTIRFVFVLNIFLMGGCSRFGEQPGTVFDRYRAALDAGDLEVIGRELSTSSKSYLCGLESWIYHADGDELLSLRPFDLFLVLRIRMLREEWGENAWRIAEKGSAALGEELVHPMWLPLLVNDFVGDKVERVDFYEGIAGGHLLVNGRKIKLRLRFENEGQWKIDVVSYFRDSFNKALEEFLGEEYRNLNLVNELLESKYGELYSKELYLERVSRG